MNDKLERLRKDLIRGGFLKESVQIEGVIQKFAKKKKAIYTAAFLTDASKIQLKNWWRSFTKSELLENEYVHHKDQNLQKIVCQTILDDKKK